MYTISDHVMPNVLYILSKENGYKPTFEVVLISRDLERIKQRVRELTSVNFTEWSFGTKLATVYTKVHPETLTIQAYDYPENT